MKITIAGTPGSGKSSVARLVAEKLGLKHYSVGDFMRSIARKRKITLLELMKLAETDGGTIDHEIDASQIKLRGSDNFVVDSRLGFHFIPNSFKIFLKCSEKESAKRIYSHLRDEEKENTSLVKTIENLKKRKRSERGRYKKYYGIDITKADDFDLIIDTTKLQLEQVTDIILKKLKK